MTDLSSKDRATAAARMIFRRKIAPARGSRACVRPLRNGQAAAFDEGRATSPAVPLAEDACR